MTGEERRNEILHTILSAKAPVSGSALAKKYHVSRQAIVQDIALLRAADYDIVATTKGYLIGQTPACSRVFHVCHSDEQIEDELNTIVDIGGKVRDVFVDHKTYGVLRADLIAGSRREVSLFMNKMMCGQASPLKNLTSGIHYHTVWADKEETLDEIEKELREKGYLTESSKSPTSNV
ncbi:MAG: transcription repressor NadR [Lachnospiraceae bacterium]|nr:transcription repressor NadR [Lachnospiraceae bacterium]